MLELIRKHSNSIAVKIFLTILALTFVLFFGVSDVIRRFIGKDYVVKIGNHKISPVELKIEKAKRFNIMRGHIKNINEKDLTANILHQLIWENIVDQASIDYGIVVSDETMKKYISGMNMFRDKEGRFNANLLRGFLQKIQVPETMFLESSKKDIKNAIIKSPFLYVAVFAEADLFTRANLEKRNLTVIKLLPSSFKITEKPTTEMLQKFYSNNPDLFTVEETRSFKILELQESSVEKNIIISEDEIKEAYDRSGEKEDRSYDDMRKELESSLKQEKLQSEINDLARQIEDALMAGEDVSETAKKFNLNVIAFEGVNSQNKNAQLQEAVNLPYKEDIITVAFSIEEGTDSSFSETLDAKKNRVYWLLHLDEITPKHAAAFEKSSDKVLVEWTKSRQREKALQTATSFIRETKEGKSLDKLAAENGRISNTTESFDRYGQLSNEKNTRFANIIAEVHENAFAMQELESNYVELDGEIVVYQVKNIISPSKIDPKDEKKYQAALRGEIVEDMYQQLIGHMSKKLEVKINHEMLTGINEGIDQNKLDEIF
ncbi:MAG: SurA N-terminal domain-containing protein [Holosporaceae bacterium]|jgi:peptidyl-prolyl cis-trans isomerase D|nr:SurA N-terminal domain-containing protein [Holosporaceae bacterium]